MAFQSSLQFFLLPSLSLFLSLFLFPSAPQFHTRDVINERMGGMIIESNVIMIFSNQWGVFDFKIILTLFLICGFMKNIEFKSHIAKC